MGLALKGVIAEGAQVGNCTVSLDGRALAIYPLVAVEGTQQGSLWRRFIGPIKAMGQKTAALNFSLAFPR